ADVTGTQGDGILLSNITGGSINIFDTEIHMTGGTGLRMNNVAADALIDSLTTSQTTGAAVAITGGTTSNTYHFGGTTTITQPGSNALNINNTGAAVTFDNLVASSTAAGAPAVSLTSSSGKITFGNLDLETTNTIGLYGRSLSNLVVLNGSLTSLNGGAI